MDLQHPLTHIVDLIAIIALAAIGIVMIEQDMGGATLQFLIAAIAGIAGYKIRRDLKGSGGA